MFHSTPRAARGWPLGLCNVCLWEIGKVTACLKLASPWGAGYTQSKRVLCGGSHAARQF